VPSRVSYESGCARERYRDEFTAPFGDPHSSRARARARAREERRGGSVSASARLAASSRSGYTAPTHGAYDFSSSGQRLAAATATAFFPNKSEG